MPASLPEDPRLHTDSLSAAAWSLACRLGEILDDDFYLAGSAALALHLGHRPVAGLDLMSAVHRLLPPQRRDLLQLVLGVDEGARVETARDGYLYLRSGEGVPFRFFYYPYPLAAPLVMVAGVEGRPGLQVASAIDLGLMKLGAIISRGSRRDFVDLFLLSPVVPLPQLLSRAEDKFGHVLDFPLQAIKALSDRSQWGDEPLPTLESDFDEAAMESWLSAEIARFADQEIGG